MCQGLNSSLGFGVLRVKFELGVTVRLGLNFS